MFKLNGHSLTKGEWFEPESQSLILTERNSTSTITLGPDAPDIGFDDWILDETPEGPVVWRVKNLGDTFQTDTRNIDLEHVIRTLDDITLFETDDEGEPPNLPAYNAVLYLLGKQSIWTLGDFQYSVSNPYDFSKESILDALENVTETLDDAVWEYDMTQFPFVLHIRQRNTEVTSEMRGGRNLSTMKRTMSRSGMYTRFYPVGQNNLQLPDKYVSLNEALYGRIDKSETDQSKTSVEALTAWANGRLRKHAEPEVNIQISGLELSAETGESLDRLKLNRVCRCPLPEFNTTIAEKITKLQWRDYKKEPLNVTVTLCNNTQDVATIIRQEKRRGGGGSGGAGQAKQNYLFEVNGDNLLYEVFDDCGHVHGLLRMTSESLRITFDNLTESVRSELLMTAESLRITFENEAESLRSQIQITAESLRSTFEDETGSLRSQILQEAGRISLVVEGTGESAHVKPASIVAAINGQSGSYVQISADKIDLSGYVQASQLASEIADLADVTMQRVDVQEYIDAVKYTGTEALIDTIETDTLTVNLEASIAELSLNGSAGFTDCIVDGYVDSTTGIVTLYRASGTNPITFNRATPASITLVPSWSGNVFTVTATGATVTPITETFSTSKGTGDGGSVGGLVTIDGYDASTHKGYAYVKATRIGSGNGVLYRIVADASGVYSAGYDSARISAITWGGTSGNVGHVEISTTGATSRDFTVRASAVGITYDSATHKYKGDVYAYVSGTVRHTASYDSGTQAYQDGGAVTGFSTTAPANETYSSYTNGADGYQLSGSGSSANAYIVVKGTITTAGGGQQTKDYYLQSAPTKLYRKGYADGVGTFTQVRDGGGNENFVAYYYNSTYGRYESLGSHKWYYK